METMAVNNQHSANRLNAHGFDEAELMSVNEQMRNTADEIIRTSREQYFKLKSTAGSNWAECVGQAAHSGN